MTETSKANLSAAEAAKWATARVAELHKEKGVAARAGHIVPCESNFDYTQVASGDKSALELVLSRIRAK
jgi:hypothetical protein